jgi:hypothetical protein
MMKQKEKAADKKSAAFFAFTAIFAAILTTIKQTVAKIVRD